MAVGFTDCLEAIAKACTEVLYCQVSLSCLQWSISRSHVTTILWIVAIIMTGSDGNECKLPSGLQPITDLGSLAK